VLLAEPHLLAVIFFTIGLILGCVLHRGDFCTAGILRDIFLFRDYTLVRHLLLAVALTMFLFLLARAAGVLPFDPPPSYGRVTLLGAAGGLLFGVGMVLAGGCVVGTLYKMGAGSLTSFIAFAGIVAGSLLYAEIYPLIRMAADRSMLTTDITLFQVSPLAGAIVGWLLVLVSLPVFLNWHRQGKMVVSAAAEGYMQPWRVAVVLAVLNLLVYLFAGWPLGISTAYAKIGAFLEVLVAPGRVAELAYFREPSLVVPTAGGMLTGGAGPRTDLIFFTEMALLLGIVAGSFLSALALREFRIYRLPPARQVAAAFGGGMLMALGARLASGCNFKFILGGLPLLSFQAILFVGGMLAGAWLGSLLLARVILRPSAPSEERQKE
jgi:uncharacterized protein